MSLGERLKTIRGRISQKEFGEMFGAAPNTIRKYELNNGAPNTDFVLSVCNHYNINPMWLLTGEGSMNKNMNTGYYDIDLASTSRFCEIDSGKNDQISIPQWRNPDPEMFDYIPLAETQLSAGGGAFVISEEIEGYYAFRKSWLNRVASSTKNLVLMRILGDSMAPTIQNDDTVMIDTGRKSLKEGMIYAIRVDSTVMIKRLSLRLGGKIQIISDNRQEYESYEAELKDLHVIGQIIFFCRTFATE